MKLIRLICAVIFAIIIAGCTEKETQVEVSSVSLNTATIEMVEGETFSHVATVLPKDAEYDGVTWASSNASVARVNSGTVTALKEGTATITASAGGKSATCTVKVSTKVVSVTSITLDKTSLSMKVGETETIIATVNPDNATDKTVTWGSSDVSVATVADGIVTAKSPGTVTVTAKSGICTTDCNVTVTVDIESLSLDKTNLSLSIGETAQLTATVKPDNATDKNVSWTSSDETVAKVDDGKVTAVKSGKATITAKCGGKIAECAVTVTVSTGSVTLDKTSLSLTVGETVQLTATVKPDDATDKNVTWTSSDESVAKVVNGKVTAVKSGKATITAKCGGKTAECAVIVTVPTGSVTLDKTSLSLAVGETVQLTATVKPDDATDKNVTWTSSDESVAKVVNGKVTAVNAGKATIIAKCGGKTAECAVTVTVPTGSVTIDKTSLSLAVGETAQLTATVKPDDATDKNVAWASSDESVAKVDNGKVTAVKSGKAIIIAKCGGKTAECAVTVTVPTGSVTLDKTTLSLAVGETAQLTATVKPDDATDKNVTWTSSDESVAKVVNGKVTAVKSGKATITAKCGGKTAECAVIVTVPTGSVTLDKTSLSLAVGETVQLTATVKPDDATDKNVTWTSSDESVAKVVNGKVTAVKSGKATITAKCGGKTAECAVTVTVPVTSLTLDRTTLSLAVGETAQLTATVKPDDATDKNVSWTSSDEFVAKVDNGKVTAVKAGKSTIIAKCGGLTAECVVIVRVPVSSITLDNTSISLTVGETAQLTVTVRPEDATDKNVNWTSSDESVAKVDNGKVTAIKAGHAIVTANCGNKLAECDVTVMSPTPLISYTTVNGGSVDEFVSGYDRNGKKISFSQEERNGVWEVFYGTNIYSIKIESFNNANLKSIKINKPVTVTSCYLRCPNLEAIDLSICNVMIDWGLKIACPKIETLDVSSWNTSNIISMHFLFEECSNLKLLKGITSWNTSNVKNMYGLFFRCYNLTSLNLSTWDTSKVTNMSSLFEGCSKLESVNLSNWNTMNVGEMKSMFSGCISITSLDLPKFVTRLVTDVSYMFNSCRKLKHLDLSSWDTTNITKWEAIFGGCRSLETLDLSGWTIRSDVSTSYMFSGCSNLKKIYMRGCDESTIAKIKSIKPANAAIVTE